VKVLEKSTEAPTPAVILLAIVIKLTAVAGFFRVLGQENAP